MINIIKKSLWRVIDVARNTLFSNSDKILYVVEASEDSENIAREVRRRLAFFAPKLIIEPVLKEISIFDMVNHNLIVYLSVKKLPQILKVKKKEVFNLDFSSNYLDGWDYHYLLSKLQPEIYKSGINFGKEKLLEFKSKLSADFDKSYIFGTGPSLDKARDYSFNDGVRIVSNTIVKDEELWLHLDPHFIVAGDAIYHFGIGEFAKQFRNDLKLRLSQTNTHFVYPAQFHPFCSVEFSDYKDRLIPVPIGSNKSIHHDLSIDYSLPIHGNVLLLLLLPLSCTFSKTIYMWGFDGRSPNDKLFWKNSSKQFYPEHVDELISLHPLFFDKLLPKNAPDSYVKKVHGDVLDTVLNNAETAGFNFGMLHDSYTETLQKRRKSF